MRGTVVITLILVVATAGQVGAVSDQGTVSGKPGLDLTATDNHFGASERTTVELYISNDGQLYRGGPSEYEDQVRTARDLTLEIDQDTLADRYGEDIEVKSGPVAAGTVPEGSEGPFGFVLEFGDAIEPGEYEIPIDMTYQYTHHVEYSNTESPKYNHRTRTTTDDVTIVIEDEPRFEVVSSSAEGIHVGDTGTYQFTIENVGTDTAYVADMTLSADTSQLYFGGRDNPQGSTNVYLDSLEPGETRNASVQMGVDGDTTPGSYPISGAVEFENGNGVTATGDDLRLGIPVGGEQTFSLQDVESSFRVDDDGTVTGTVVNEGPRSVTNAVLVYVDSEADNDADATTSPADFAPNIDLNETAYTLGTLESGEKTAFSFSAEVASDADEGPRTLLFEVRYRNTGGDVRTSDTLDAKVEVDEEDEIQGEVLLTGIDVSNAGGTVLLTGTAGNIGETDVTGVIVSVEDTEDVTPVSPSADYFVGEIEASEFGTFELTARTNDAGAVPVKVEYVVDGTRKSTVVDVAAGSEIQSDRSDRGSVGNEPERQGPMSMLAGGFDPKAMLTPLVAVLAVLGVGLLYWRWRRR